MRKSIQHLGVASCTCLTLHFCMWNLLVAHVQHHIHYIGLWNCKLHITLSYVKSTCYTCSTSSTLYNILKLQIIWDITPLYVKPTSHTCSTSNTLYSILESQVTHVKHNTFFCKSTCCTCGYKGLVKLTDQLNQHTHTYIHTHVTMHVHMHNYVCHMHMWKKKYGCHW